MILPHFEFFPIESRFMSEFVTLAGWIRKEFAAEVIVLAETSLLYVVEHAFPATQLFRFRGRIDLFVADVQ